MIRLIDSLLMTLGWAAPAASTGPVTVVRRPLATPQPTPAAPADRPSLEQELVFGRRAARRRTRRH